MSLEDLFKNIKEKFSPRKKIDFDKQDVHLEVEPLSDIEETIVMESIQNFEGVHYLKALKRHSLACAIKSVNGVEIEDEITWFDENGTEKVKSKFLFMKDYIEKWPSPLVDIIFDAYTNMLQGIQNKLKEDIKFERVLLSEEPEEEVPEKFQRVKEKSGEGLTETEKLNKKVEAEILDAELRKSQTENKA